MTTLDEKIKPILLQAIKDWFVYYSDKYVEESDAYADYQFIETGIIKLDGLADELLEKFLVLKK